MQHFLLRTWSTDEHYNGGCDLGRIAIDTELAKTILHRGMSLKKMKVTDNSLTEMRFWDSTCDFLSASDVKLDEAQETELGHHGRCVGAPELMDLPHQRTECDEMIIRDDGVAWVAVPKHTDVYVTTEEVPFNVIEALIGRESQ